MNDFDDDNKTYGLFDSVINRQLFSDLKAENAKVYKFPEVVTKKTDANAESLSVTKNITDFDCLIFTDVLTVRYFLQILEENEFDIYDLDEVRILTYGEAISDELRLSQIHADIIPTLLENTAIIDSLKNYFGTKDFLQLRILIFHEKNNQPEIADSLIQKNLQVTQFAVYEITSRRSDLTKYKIILESGGIDEFIITQPIDLIALEYCFGNKNLNKVLPDTKIIAKGELISKLLTENNIRHHKRFGQF